MQPATIDEENDYLSINTHMYVHYALSTNTYAYMVHRTKALMASSVCS